MVKSPIVSLRTASSRRSSGVSARGVGSALAASLVLAFVLVAATRPALAEPPPSEPGGAAQAVPAELDRALSEIDALASGEAPSAADAEATAGAPRAEPEGATFSYWTTRTVSEGTGAYEGYSDTLRSAGTYTIASRAGALSVHANYQWIYRGDSCDDGSIDRDVEVALPSRRYVGQTDLDDYDATPGGPFATWLWVPTTLAIGDTVPILERTFRVVDFVPPQGRAELAGLSLIHLRSEGRGRRDDAYGNFDTTFVDDYWFDRASGYFVATAYREEDVGSLNGAPARFVLVEEARVSTASYLASAVSAQPSIETCASGGWDGGADASVVGLLASIVAAFTSPVVLGILLLGFVFWLRARGGRLFRPAISIDGMRARVRALARPQDLPFVPPELSPHLAPFLAHFVEVALAAGERVVVCELSNGRCVGVGIGDREGRVASIFAQDGDACELVRKELGFTEFFTEHRHLTIPSVDRAALEAAVTTAPHAYNELETYEILELSPARILPYDSSIVAPMTSEDLVAVEQLSKTVHGVAGHAWLSAALAAGDVGYVARLDGAIVGFGFSSVAGDVGRIYGNTVSPAHRGRGIGKELARARVAAAVGLGASRVLAEVATWNVGSLEVLKGLGFESRGKMWVETALATPRADRVVRR